MQGHVVRQNSGSTSGSAALELNHWEASLQVLFFHRLGLSVCSVTLSERLPHLQTHATMIIDGVRRGRQNCWPSRCPVAVADDVSREPSLPPS